jgi:hypothetical protein
MAGVDGSRDPIPLPSPDGEPIDAERFWVKLKHATGDDLDKLQAIASRTATEREVFEDGTEGLPRVRTVTYQETGMGPVVYKAIELGLIEDARLPTRKKDGTVGVYEWQKARTQNIVWLKGRPGIALLASLFYVISEYVLSPLFRDVVTEGEDSSGSQVSEPESTEV